MLKYQYFKDISDYFRQLTIPLEYREYNITLEIVYSIYYIAENMGEITQTIKKVFFIY